MEVWDVYFASLCGWMLHPGYLRDEESRPSVEEIASIADEMMEARANRFPEEE